MHHDSAILVNQQGIEPRAMCRHLWERSLIEATTPLRLAIPTTRSHSNA